MLYLDVAFTVENHNLRVQMDGDYFSGDFPGSLDHRLPHIQDMPLYAINHVAEPINP
jgi:hypothetical protein